MTIYGGSTFQAAAERRQRLAMAKAVRQARDLAKQLAPRKSKPSVMGKAALKLVALLERMAQ